MSAAGWDGTPMLVLARPHSICETAKSHRSRPFRLFIQHFFLGTLPNTTANQPFQEHSIAIQWGHDGIRGGMILPDFGLLPILAKPIANWVTVTRSLLGLLPTIFPEWMNLEFSPR